MALPPHDLGTTGSYTPEIRHSAAEFSRESEFHSHILTAITSSEHHRELIYINAIPLWGGNVVRFLNEAVETRPVRWGRAGLLTHDETRHLWPGVGTTIESFQPPYAGSRKEPDFFLRADALPHPTFVMESGWSESFPRL